MTDVNKLSKKIRELWCKEVRDFELRTTGIATGWGNTRMARWDGGRTAGGKFYDSIWPQIAEFCISNKLDPQTLIRAVFHKVISNAPYPNMALGNTALGKYKLYSEPTTKLEAKNKIIHEFESQKSRALAGVLSLQKYYKLDEETAWKSMLAAKDEPLSPLFRYCVAKNQNWEDLAKEYYPAALHQYSQNVENYNSVWMEWISNELKEGFVNECKDSI